MAKQKTDNTLSIMVYILAIFTSFIGPLIILLASEDDNAKKHARNALNWIFSLYIYYAASVILILFFIGVLLIFALGITSLVFLIIAAVRTSNGTFWQIPLSIKFFKI